MLNVLNNGIKQPTVHVKASTFHLIVLGTLMKLWIQS